MLSSRTSSQRLHARQGLGYTPATAVPLLPALLASAESSAHRALTLASALAVESFDPRKLRETVGASAAPPSTGADDGPRGVEVRSSRSNRLVATGGWPGVSVRTAVRKVTTGSRPEKIGSRLPNVAGHHGRADRKHRTRTDRGLV